MSRYIGIRHRTKRTVNNEARPTQVAIVENGEVTAYDLEDEQSELDWVFRIFPTSWRKLETGESTENIKPHHIKTRTKDDVEIVTVPESYDGFRSGDVVAMSMGGSGDRLAFALSRRSEMIGNGNVMRIAPAMLKRERGDDGDKDNDAQLLADLARTKRDLFYPVTPRDRDLIALTFVLDERTEAMKARMACQQRLRARYLGQIFCSEAGLYPQGALEDEYQKVEANDVVMQNLFKEEGRCNRQLEKAVENISVYNELFAPIKGVGPSIASNLIVAIGDIRRFATGPKLTKFLGAHVMPDGRFPRKRRGEICNWSPRARQALFLLGDQFNRRPDTPWGQKLREYKVKFRTKHPDIECSACAVPWDQCKKNTPDAPTGNHVKKYTNGHIHKMALWRTLTVFTRWLHKEWTKLEAQPEPMEQPKASGF